MSDPYICQSQDADRIYAWLLNRGGIFIWRSVNLSNPGASWTSPAQNAEGKPVTKPNWQCDDVPERHITNLADVMVCEAKEVKRFHVATRMGGNGLSIKVTDGGTRKIRAEVEKAKEKYGKPAWYEFDYCDEKNAVIMIEDVAIQMTDWVARQNEVLAS